MDSDNSFHTKGAEYLKAHLPNSDVVEDGDSRFWSWHCWSNKCSSVACARDSNL